MNCILKNNPTKSSNILITKNLNINYKLENVDENCFNPSKNSPPNVFLNKLEERLKIYWQSYNSPIDGNMLHLHQFNKNNTTLDNNTLDNTTLDNTTLDNTTLDNTTLDNNTLDNNTLDNSYFDNNLETLFQFQDIDL